MSETTTARDARIAEIERSLSLTPSIGLQLVDDIPWLLTELRSALTRAREAERAAEAWNTYASHQEWCRACAEDGVDSCPEGSQLKHAAVTSREGNE